MGKQFLDQYSILHFATGNIAYFWGFGVLELLIGHISFEFLENTEAGMKFINENLTWWPGKKVRADDFVNILGDNVSAVAGWYFAKYLDEKGKRESWY